VPNVFRSYPTGADAQTQMNVHHTALAALPTEVLNLPPYGNWTAQGWNIRFHGNVSTHIPNETCLIQSGLQTT
jgi:hypothetical protein